MPKPGSELLVLAFVGGLLIPMRGTAQTCVGGPPENGFSIAGIYARSADAGAYGPEIGVNPEGPFALRGGVRRLSNSALDNPAYAYTGGVRGELAVVGLSVCPGLSLQYPTAAGNPVGTVWTAGLALGREVAAVRQLSLTAFAEPQFQRIRRDPILPRTVDRTTQPLSSGPGTSQAPQRTAPPQTRFNEFGAQLGLQLAGRALSGGISAAFSTFDQARPVFSFNFGVLTDY